MPKAGPAGCRTLKDNGPRIDVPQHSRLDHPQPGVLPPQVLLVERVSLIFLPFMLPAQCELTGLLLPTGQALSDRL